MARLILKELVYKNYGKILSISNGIQEIYVTIDIGPRIIKYNLIGEPNVMFNDLNREINHGEKAITDFFGEGKTWNIYGGHRFWVSPEALPETYYPDDEPVEYSVLGNTITFQPPVQRATGWKETITLKVSEDTAEVEVHHALENTSDAAKTGAIWALSVMAPGGVSAIRQADEETGFLPNRTLILWPYNNLADKRFILENDFIFLKQDAAAEKAFKIGTNNTKGKLAYLNNGTVFQKRYTPDHAKETYPDNGVSTEIYTNAKFLEMETLGALKTLRKGEKTFHTENWSLTKLSEKETGDYNVLKKYL
jgi:hypothetical protein